MIHSEILEEIVIKSEDIVEFLALYLISCLLSMVHGVDEHLCTEMQCSKEHIGLYFFKLISN